MKWTGSIRTIQTIPFVLLFMLGFGTIATISYLNDHSNIRIIQRELAEGTGNRIENHLRSFFLVPDLMVRSNQDATSSGDIKLDDPAFLVRHFVRQIRFAPNLTFVSVGMPDGHYVGASRNPMTQEIMVFTALPNEGSTFNAYQLGEKDSRGALVDRGNPFDARTRGWYKQADSLKKAAWYPVYKYTTYPSLGIGISGPVYDSAGVLQCVYTADVALDQLNTFLRELKIEHDGIAFLMDANDDLIATSTPDQVFSVSGKTAIRIPLSESRNVALKAAAKVIHMPLDSSGIVEYQENGIGYIMNMRNFQDSYGLSFKIGVILSEGELAASAVTESRVTLFFMLLTAFICALLGLWVSRLLSKPLEILTQESALLARGDWYSLRSFHSPIREVNELARSFQSMAKELQELLQTMEQRVKDRTEVLEHSNQQLEEANATRNKFFSIISHDLKNPFMTLVGMSDALIEDLQAKEYDQAFQYAKVIHQSSESGYKLLLNLLDWARAQHGRLQVNPQTVNLHTLIDDAIALLQISSLNKEISFLVKVRDISIVTDPNMLATVFRNLIGNAVKYSARGGQIEIKSELYADHCQVHIRDYGMGIQAQDLSKLFRMDIIHTTLGTEREKGTGLGLILCREYLQKLGGVISVQSEWGKGSTFTITLPLR